MKTKLTFVLLALVAVYLLALALPALAATLVAQRPVVHTPYAKPINMPELRLTETPAIFFVIATWETPEESAAYPEPETAVPYP